MILQEQDPFKLKQLGKQVENVPEFWDTVKFGVICSLDVLKVLWF